MARGDIPANALPAEPPARRSRRISIGPAGAGTAPLVDELLEPAHTPRPAAELGQCPDLLPDVRGDVRPGRRQASPRQGQDQGWAMTGERADQGSFEEASLQLPVYRSS